MLYVGDREVEILVLVVGEGEIVVENGGPMADEAWFGGFGR